mgnify:CR=1 FL=1
MTESEAIKELQQYVDLPFEMDVLEEAVKMSIQALEEVQQYRAIGTPEELQDMKSNYFEALSDWRQYRKIGTLEECRAAREKQISKKPIMKQYFEDSEEKYLCCPTCGEILTDRIPADNKTFYFYCMNCGQKFDWGDEE